MEAHERVLAEIKVLDAQVGGLLHPCSGVVEEQQQPPVPQCQASVAG